MNAQGVFALLEGLGAQAVRGADKGLPPPTLSYALSASGEETRLTLVCRARLPEENDGRISQAQGALGAAGFLMKDCREEQERDTGLWLAVAVFSRTDGPGLLVDGQMLPGCAPRLTEEWPEPVTALGGGVRPRGGPQTALTLTLPHAASGPAAQALRGLGPNALPLTVDGKRYLGYLLRRETRARETALTIRMEEDQR